MNSFIFRPLRPRESDCSFGCASCSLCHVCLPLGLTDAELDHIDRRMVTSRRKLLRGEVLYHAGGRFEDIYFIWTGFFKICLGSMDGRSQVMGFRMGGEPLGLDGIDNASYQADAIALEDSVVCVLPFEQLQALSREVPSLQRQLHRQLSQELVRHQESMLMLGSMLAEERLAAFLLNLSYRLKARGFSDSALVLRMSREEIASFLGLSIETVSRTFTRFQAQGLLFVRSRQITITDPVGLRMVLEGPTVLADR